MQKNTLKIDTIFQSIETHIQRLGRPVTLMEVCGTHTMAAFRSGLRSRLPEGLTLLSGPGCPVCVTPNSYLDKAIAIAQVPDIIIASFGDMVRVPGSVCSLEYARARGADIRMVYSPSDALHLATSNPKKRIIFLGVGFETTIPTIAWTIKEASNKGITNYFVLCAHKTIPPAMNVLLQGEVHIDGFLCPGHVSTIIGADAFESICSEYQIPCVVTGFEPHDMAGGIDIAISQLVHNDPSVEIQYSRCVSKKGNKKAQEIIDEVFISSDAKWRGLGSISQSGLTIRDCFHHLDADRCFADIPVPVSKENPKCLCGDILKGCAIPFDCTLFGTACTPDNPAGSCMVSSEGTCAAYFKYGKHMKNSVSRD